jgi:hypothetical protein
MCSNTTPARLPLQIAGRAGESAWLLIDGAHFDSHFKCTVIGVHQTKVNKTKLIAFGAGSTRFNCAYTAQGDYMVMNKLPQHAPMPEAGAGGDGYGSDDSDGDDGDEVLRCSAVQCSAVQCSAVQCSSAKGRVVRAPSDHHHHHRHHHHHHHHHDHHHHHRAAALPCPWQPPPL